MYAFSIPVNSIIDSVCFGFILQWAIYILLSFNGNNHSWCWGYWTSYCPDWKLAATILYNIAAGLGIIAA
jgi:hypothetical protein